MTSLVKNYSTNISVKLLSSNCNEMAINLNFRFSYMLSNGNKNNIFVEANVRKKSAKFQSDPPYSFRGVFYYFCFLLLSFFANFAFWLPW